MKGLITRRRFTILSTFFLTGLILFTLPMSYAVWREVLGVDAGVDTGDWPATTTPVATATLVVSPTFLEPGSPTATTIPPTDLPSMELTPTESLPTDSIPTEPPTTNPPPTEEVTATPEAPPTELPNEPPTEASTPSE